MTRILIVEDEAIIAQKMARLIASAGNDVLRLAYDGAQAIQIANEERPDLALIDISLGGKMDGIMVAQHLWQELKVPVIYTTAYADDETVQRAKVTSPVGYLIKPINDLELLAMLENVIHRLRLEQTLREGDALFQNIFESSAIGIAAIDAQGRFILCNPATCHIWGYTREELAQLKVLDVTHPDDAPRGDWLADAGGDDQPHHFRFERRYIRKDGEVIWVRATATQVFNPEEKDKLQFTVTLLEDITLQKQAESLLQQRQAELNALNIITRKIASSTSQQQMLDAVLVELVDLVEADGAYIYLQDEDSKNLTLAASYGMPANVLAHRHILAAGGEAGGQGERAGKFTPGDYLKLDEMNIPELGDKPEHHDVIAVQIGNDDHVHGVLGAVRTRPEKFNPSKTPLLEVVGQAICTGLDNLRLASDASALEVYRELNRLRSELIANVSHELRTPLGLIKLYATTLLRPDVNVPSSTQHEFLQDINSETEKLERIVANLLDLSRLENQHLWLDKQPVDLGNMLSHIGQVMQPRLAANQKLFVDVPEVALVTLADAHRIEQVIRNLVENASKYSPDGSRITLRARGEETRLIVSVSDQGIGIPADQLELVFERFHRVIDERVKQTGGAGLGLSVCRGIVEAHGGKIWAESEPGQGSIFYFTLPSANMDQEGAAEES